MDFAAFARRLRGRQGWSAEWQVAEDVVKEDLRAALELHDALRAELEHGGHDLAIASVRNHLVGSVAASSTREASDIAFSIAQPRADDVGRLATLLPPDAAISILASRAGERPDVAWLLAHELLVRGVDLAPARDILEKLRPERTDPTWMLPLELLTLEVHYRKFVVSYNARGWAASPPSPPPTGDPRLRPLPDVLPAGRLDRTATAAVARQVSAPVDDWGGGKSVAVFQRSEGTGWEGDVEPSLNEAGTAWLLGPEDAAAQLFALAAQGGAYSGPQDAAAARVATFAALTGMLDLDAGSPYIEIAGQAALATWVGIVPGPPWFYDVAWDCWIAAVTGERITVLAVSDTD